MRADLVLEGGGIKGIGLAGAVAAVTDAGYVPRRISGTSAGALVGVIAAAGARGAQLGDIMRRLDFRAVADRHGLGLVPLIGPGLALLSGTGLYRGEYLLEWITDELATLGVRTWRDLRLDDPSLPSEQRYRLVVTCSDLTLGQLVRLPWDYRSVYGLDPDAQPVAHAVRASMSIPFLFEPTTLTHADPSVSSTLVDGGLLSNFPIDSLDRTDGAAPAWPTFGVTITTAPKPGIGDRVALFHSRMFDWPQPTALQPEHRERLEPRLRVALPAPCPHLVGAAAAEHRAEELPRRHLDRRHCAFIAGTGPTGPPPRGHPP